MKKYELTDETLVVGGVTLHRIRSLIDTKYAKAGDLGGYIEKESNLSHEGDAWISGNACISGNAWISGDAWISGNARISGDARIARDAKIESDDDYCAFEGFGSANRGTYAYKTQKGEIGITCGYFHGSLEEFIKRVHEMHGNDKYAKQYNAIVEVIRAKFDK